MWVLKKLDELIMKHAVLKGLAFGVILFIIFPLWGILGRLEQIMMWLKGYDYDRGYSGYRHRETGKRPPSS